MVRYGFLVALLLCTVARGGEPAPDPVTLLLPARTRVVIRVASLDRLDEIGKELKVLWVLLEEDKPLSTLFIDAMTGLGGLPFDRTKPFYCSINRDDDWCVMFHAEEGAEMPLSRRRKDAFALVRKGMLFFGSRSAIEEPRRLEALPLLKGDVAFVYPVAPLIAENRDSIKKILKELEERHKIAGLTLPPTAVPLVKALLETLVEAILGLEDLHFALRFRSGKLDVDALVRSAPRSALRAFLSRAGEPGNTRLMAYLPKTSLWNVDSCGIASWLDREAGRLLDKAYGEGAGKTLLLALSPSAVLSDHLTGRSARTLTLPGMWATQVRAVHEVREGAPIHEAIAALDVASLNEWLEEARVPISYELRRGASKHGETEIHHLRVQSTVPEVAVFLPQLQTSFAAEGRHLFVVRSATADMDLRTLIDAVRRGEPDDHPHVRAMTRLSDSRHEGLSVNLGGLKQLMALLAFGQEHVARLMAAIPDELRIAATLTVRDGGLHLRGEVPLTEILAVVQKMLKE
ncbi:MAG: hypothetical protein ACYSX0_03310 [Planctomycetota bacterium]|jgi:hypothetical protein